MASQEPIAVIGGGVSGLAAAYELVKAGRRPVVFEQREQLGGLARSTTLGGGRIECYYHFICGADHTLRELASELGIRQRMHERPAHTSYYVDGRLYPFTSPLDILRFSPISFPSRLRFGLHSALARRLNDWAGLEQITAEQWLIKGAGREAYEVIWQPLLRMKFGDALGEVSAAWMWHRIWRLTQSRKSLLRPEDLGYFEGGTETLLNALRQRITAGGGEVLTSSPVRGVLARDGHICGVQTDQGSLPASAVISTVPLPALLPLLPECASEYAQELGKIRFLGVVCLLAQVPQHLTESFWVNVNDARAPFNGIVEYTNLNPWAEGGSPALYIPLYLSSDDPRFVMSDADLAASLLGGVKALFGGFEPKQVGQWKVTRDAYAQALCPPGFSRQMPAAKSPLPGLYVTDSTQLYPSDRSISGTIALAQRAAKLVAETAG
jgi:protoporphyrinogen oxidase